MSTKQVLYAGASLLALMSVAIPMARAQLTVGDGQNVTNSVTTGTVTVTGNNNSFTNTSTGIVDVFSGKLFIGAGGANSAVMSSNFTINNAGTITEEANATPGTGVFFTNASGITINNSGTFRSLDVGLNHDDHPISIEQGVTGAVVNNSGTIAAAGGSADSSGVGVSGGASNVVINNLAGGVIENTGAGHAILLQQANDAAGNILDPAHISNVTITNAGSIIGGTTLPAFAVGTFGPGTATVTGVKIINSGTFDGSASGTAIDNSLNTAPITITNSGIIKGGIFLGPGSGSTFTNTASGVLDVTAGKLFAGTGPNTAVITSNFILNNAGTITQEASASPGSGAFFTNATGITINNSGTFQSLDVGLNHDDRPISFEQGVNGAVVNNSGTIATAGPSDSSGGVDVSGGASNVVINNLAGGVIENTGAGHAILLQQANDAAGNITDPAHVSNVTISNAGSIIGGTALPAFAAIGSNQVGTSFVPGPATIIGVKIINSGTFDGSASGVAIDNSRNTAALSITNGGTIKGNILFGSGGDTVTLTGGSIQGSVIGQNAGDSLIVNPGTGKSATLTGAVTNVSNVSIASGSATFAQTPTGFSQLSLGSGATATVTGPFALGPASTLALQFTPNSAPLLTVNGSATLGGTLLLKPDATGIYQRGSSFTVLNVTGSVTGNFSTVQSTLGTLALHTALVGDPVLDIVLDAGVFNPPPGATPNQIAVGNALANIAAPNADLAAIIAAINALPPAQQNHALSELTGEIYTSALATTGTNLRQVLGTTLDHYTRGTSEEAPPITVWGEAFGSFAKIDSDGNGSAVDIRTGGGVEGIDFPVGPDVIGLGFGYARNSLSLSTVPQRGNLSTFTFAPHGQHRWGPFFIEGTVGGSYAHGDFTRTLDFGINRAARGSLTGYSAGTRWVVRRPFRPDPQWEIEPSATGSYAYVHQGSLGESDANAADLALHGNHESWVQSILGVRLTHFAPLWGGTLKPELRLAWEHEYTNATPPASQGFAAAPASAFTTKGANPGHDAGHIAVSLSYVTSLRLAVYSQYQATVGGRDEEHRVSAGFRFEW